MSRITTLPFGFSNAILVQETGIVLVDTGAPATLKKYQTLFAKLQIEPRDIGLIVITHGHTDHFAHANELRELTGAPILCHRKALPALQTGKNPPVHPRNELGESVLKLIAGKTPPALPIDPDILIDTAYDLNFYGVAGKVIPTPGHSECSVSVLLDSGDAVVGDLLVASPFTGKPTPAYLSDDPDALFASIRMLLPHANTFYSGHGGPFTRAQVESSLSEK